MTDQPTMASSEIRRRALCSPENLAHRFILLQADRDILYALVVSAFAAGTSGAWEVLDGYFQEKSEGGTK